MLLHLYFLRYNLSASIQKNINLTPALLSRFDLIWIIVDNPDYQEDLLLAQHVTHLYKYNKAPPGPTSHFSISLIQRYIALCKRVVPIIPKTIKDYIVDAYVALRIIAREEKSNDFLKSSKK
jgi:DNA replication licensing factor MCM7